MCFLCRENEPEVNMSRVPDSASLQLEAYLLEAFEHEPTDGQKRLFHAFSRFTLSDKERCALLLRGYAGTGKTTCVSLLVRALEQLQMHYVLLAPTGRAARVLANYSGRSAGAGHVVARKGRGKLGEQRLVQGKRGVNRLRTWDARIGARELPDVRADADRRRFLDEIEVRIRRMRNDQLLRRKAG